MQKHLATHFVASYELFRADQIPQNYYKTSRKHYQKHTKHENPAEDISQPLKTCRNLNCTQNNNHNKNDHR